MPFQPGHGPIPGAGRPKKAASLREILRNHPIKDKKKLADAAYEFACGGSVQWAEWIAKHSGEGAQAGDSFDLTLSLLMLWRQWQLTPEQEVRILERLTPETRAQLLPVFEGEAREVADG